MSNILDPDTFNPNDVSNHASHGQLDILKHARRRILALLLEKRYNDGLILLQAVIGTNKYSTISFWKVGAELVKRNCPDELADFLYAASISVKGRETLPIFHAWVRQLLVENRQEKALEGIESCITQEPFASDPECAKIRALILYEKWTDESGKDALTASTFKILAEALGLLPDDTRLLAAYLEVMTRHDPKSVDAFAELVLEQYRDDPEWNRILLVYWSDKKSPDWIKHAIRVCQADPTMEPETIAMPLVESLSTTCRDSKTPSERQQALCFMLDLLLDRLEFGMADKWTLTQVCESVNQISTGTRMPAHRTMHSYVRERRVVEIIDDVLAHHDYDTDRFEAKLKKCRQKFQQIEQYPHRARNHKLSQLKKEMQALSDKRHIAELSRHDPWGVFLGVPSSTSSTPNSSTPPGSPLPL